MILCIVIGVAWSHVVYSFIEFFIEFCLQFVGQDIISCFVFFKHYLKHTQINYIPIENYTYDAEYCRQFFHGGGVCIFRHKALKFSSINFNEFCKDKDFEVCTILLELSYTKILVLTV
jgi:hypothetical protein